MDTKDNLEENQGFKSFIGDTEVPNPKINHLLNHDPSQVLRPPLTDDEVQKGIDSYIKETDQMINPEPPLQEGELRLSNSDKARVLDEEISPVEKPLFIALKDDPSLINKLNDFLRIHSKEGETYKVLVIGPDITEKLFETYWFTKLSEEEQKVRREQLQDASWKEGAANLADSLFQVLEASGYAAVDYEFNIKELKQEFAVIRKVKLTGQSVKQMLDTLIVFGHIRQTNEEKAFNKLRFQLIHTNDLKIRYYQKRSAALIDDISFRQAALEEVSDMLAEAIKASDEETLKKASDAATTETNTDTK